MRPKIQDKSANTEFLLGGRYHSTKKEREDRTPAGREAVSLGSAPALLLWRPLYLPAPALLTLTTPASDQHACDRCGCTAHPSATALAGAVIVRVHLLDSCLSCSLKCHVNGTHASIRSPAEPGTSPGDLHVCCSVNTAEAREEGGKEWVSSSHG